MVPRKLEGIIGEVGDRSGYKIMCFVTCDFQKSLPQFKMDREFIFVGGSTIKRGFIKYFVDLIFR